MAKPIRGIPLIKGKYADIFIEEMLKVQKKPMSKVDKELLECMEE